MKRILISLAPGVLLALAGLTSAVLPRASAPARFGDNFLATVLAEDSSTLVSGRCPSVQSVTNLIEQLKPTVTGGTQGLTMVRAALNSQYPGLVTEQAQALYYAWAWCEEIGEYVYICCSGTEFRVHLVDTVVVNVEVITELD